MSGYTYEEISKDVKEQLAILLNIEEESISDDDQMIEDLGATSVAIVQLYLNCQEKYDVRLADDIDLLESITVREFIEKIVMRSDEEEDGDGQAAREEESPETL